MPETEPRSHTPLLVSLGLTVTVLAMALFALLQYRMPPTFGNTLGLNYRGVMHFAQNSPLGDLTPMDAPRFAFLQEGLLIASLLGYVLAVSASFRFRQIPARPILIGVVTICLFLAVVCPASFTGDTYAYLAYARLPLLYGQHPYLHSALETRHFGDLSGRFVGWNRATVYGPVWTLLSYAIVAAIPAQSLYMQMIVMKLVEAAALIACALLGQRIAEHLKPGTGTLTLLAIGFNPLFLLEAPANGHNDFLMMAAFMAACLAYIQGRLPRALLWLGISMSIKLITAAVIPWIILEQWRSKNLSEKLKSTVLVLAVSFLPTVLAFLPLWQGPAMFAGLQDRSTSGAEPEVASYQIKLTHWLAPWGVHASVIHKLSAVAPQWPVILMYVTLTIWLMTQRSRNEKDETRTQRSPSWIMAWVYWTAPMLLMMDAFYFPWYFSWALLPALTRWEKRDLLLSGMCFALAIAYASLYTHR